MKANEIRKQFIAFFQERGHRYVPSSSLIPADDPTLLFTNAGMNQFKDVFLETGKRDYSRAVNSQKCMRVSGKHNDLEDVGVDTYHHTFFEMLGNWSFGDYYKREAIKWAWELFTGEWGIDPGRMWATVYNKDKEAAALWPEITGIPHERVLRFDKKENFWEMAETGPCGPCSELHIDMGEKHCNRKGEPGHRCMINGDCGRYIEIWNLVFIQYNKDKEGRLSELPQKHIDTGMGFERLVAILQGVDSNYATDLFTPIIAAVEEAAGERFDPEGRNAVAFRAIADHARALSFAIADGAMPSNEGRGYVLRMILRRAVRYGRILGIEEPFLYNIVPVVASIMEVPYPELRQHREHVSRVILSEEERFHNTVTFGLELLSNIVKKLKAKGAKSISGRDIFRLYDTFGFPVDITRLVAREQGLKLDEEGFEQLMGEQREKARQAWKATPSDETVEVYRVTISKVGATEFCGYEKTAVDATIKSLIKDKHEVDWIAEGEEGGVILDKTPFYGEAGGQVGDVGILYTGTATAMVTETHAPLPGLVIHKAKVLKGELRKGDRIRAELDENKRMETARNHTATHLLQNALRQVLGEHVKQAGSLVAPDRLRFDFTHFTAMTPREIERVEELVNRRIREDATVGTSVIGYDEARKKDVIAIFGERYGDIVRVVDIGGYSRELCGGTHVGSVGQIGIFKILSESSVAAGVRRIEAVSGSAAFCLFQRRERQIKELANILKSKPEGIVERVEELKSEQKKLKKKASRASSDEVLGDVTALLNKAMKVKGVSLVIADMESLGADSLRQAGDSIKKRLKSGVILLGSRSKGKAQFICMVTEDLVKNGLHAGRIVKMVAETVGGSGGGRPRMAQAGGPLTDKLPEALGKATKVVSEMLK